MSSDSTYDLMWNDASVLLMDMFGVDATYYAAGIGAGRAVQVILEYVEDDRSLQGVARVRSQQVEITVLNDAAVGITAAEWVDGDEVLVPPRQGSTARRFRLTRIARQDAGMVTFAAR